MGVVPAHILAVLCLSAGVASAYRRDTQTGGVGLSLRRSEGSSVPLSRGNKLVRTQGQVNRWGPAKAGLLSVLGPRRFQITESNEVTFHDEGAVGGVDEIAGELVDPTRPGEYTIRYRSNMVRDTEITTSETGAQWEPSTGRTLLGEEVEANRSAPRRR